MVCGSDLVTARARFCLLMGHDEVEKKKKKRIENKRMHNVKYNREAYRIGIVDEPLTKQSQSILLDERHTPCLLELRSKDPGSHGCVTFNTFPKTITVSQALSCCLEREG